MQPIENYSAKNKIYDTLKQAHLSIVAKSDIWNWNSIATLTRPGLQRILHLDFIYRLILDLPGDIFEFGCHYGASTSVLHNLKRVYEPNNTSRKIYTFDTFEGFPSVDNDKDFSLTQASNSIGDFSPKIESYDVFLRHILEAHASLDRSISRPDNLDFGIVKGDVSISLPSFLDKNKAVFPSLIIFDMDLYAPTLSALQSFLPRLLEGCILVFDELQASSQFPGEYLALQDSGILSNLQPVRLPPHVQNAAVFRVKKTPH